MGAYQDLVVAQGATVFVPFSETTGGTCDDVLSADANRKFTFNGTENVNFARNQAGLFSDEISAKLLTAGSPGSSYGLSASGNTLVNHIIHNRSTMSFSAWIKRSDASVSCHILDLPTEPQAFGVSFRTSASNNLEVYIQPNTGIGQAAFTSSTPFSDTTGFHHVALCIELNTSNAGKVSIWFDDNEVYSTTTYDFAYSVWTVSGVIIPYGDETTLLCLRDNNNSDYRAKMLGFIQNAAFFPDVFLTSSQVKAQYAVGKRLVIPQQLPIHRAKTGLYSIHHLNK